VAGEIPPCNIYKNADHAATNLLAANALEFIARESQQFQLRMKTTFIWEAGEHVCVDSLTSESDSRQGSLWSFPPSWFHLAENIKKPALTEYIDILDDAVRNLLLPHLI
jgi:hypothetical protein